MDAKKSDVSELDTENSKPVTARRGKMILTALAKRKAKGEKSVVSFNELGQPYGPASSEMQSYIGMLARSEVKISYKSWKQVPKEVKDTIWEHVNVRIYFTFCVI